MFVISISLWGIFRSKKKSAKGRILAHNQIAFGIFCHSSKRIVLFHVENRKHETIMPLILENVNDYTTIYSDKSSSYIK